MLEANRPRIAPDVKTGRGGVSPLPCSARAVSAPPCSANRRCHIILFVARTAACRRCLIPRTGIISLHSLITRTAGAANNITMPRSGRRLRRATFYHLKQIAHALHPTFRRGRAQRRICFCGAYGTILILAQNRGFCANERRQRSAVASRIYAACLKRSLPAASPRHLLCVTAAD